MAMSDFKITSAYIWLLLAGQSGESYEMTSEQIDDYNKLVLQASQRYTEEINAYLEAKYLVVIITPFVEVFYDRKKSLYDSPQPQFVHLDGSDEDQATMDLLIPARTLVVIHPTALMKKSTIRQMEQLKGRGFEVIHDVPPIITKKSEPETIKFSEWFDEGVIWRTRFGLTGNIRDYVKDTHKIMGYLSNLS